MSNAYNPYGGGGYRGSSRPGGESWSPPDDGRRGAPVVGPGLIPPGRDRLGVDGLDGRDLKREDIDRMKRGAPFGGPSPPIVPSSFNKVDENVNDCEIITIGNPNAAYVNMVENAIRDFRLKVDVMIPKANAKISSFIENLAQRGTIFAVVIRPENEIHRSVSVHVLRGPPKPEEHRNMPLTTAYGLIQKCFAELKRKEIGVFPDNIKAILRYMLEDRTIADSEYAMVISFLQDRRKRELAFESRTTYSNEKDIYSPEELQRRVLSIINGTEPIDSLKSDTLDHNPVNPLSQVGSTPLGVSRPYPL